MWPVFAEQSGGEGWPTARLLTVPVLQRRGISASSRAARTRLVLRPLPTPGGPAQGKIVMHPLLLAATNRPAASCPST